MAYNSTIKKWTLLNEQNVSPSPWFPLVKHTVQLGSGQIVDDYYLSPLGDVVMVLAITKEKNVILVRQYKHGIGSILLELPGGMQQKNKSVLESAVNELEEETGIKTTEEKLIPLCRLAINPTKLKQVTYGFILFDAEVNSAQKLDLTEEIEVIMMPAPDVLQLALNGKIWATDSLNMIFKAAFLYPDIFKLKY
jgi:8-oxo-dGTP pyrophosphatase MutT (NUDIX family)